MFLCDGRAFEDLLQVWEFASNFNEFLDIPPFKLEELYAALRYSEAGEIALLKELFVALCHVLLEEVSSEDAEEEEELLFLLRSYAEEKIELIWPAALSLIMKSEAFVMNMEPELQPLAHRLACVLPDNFSREFSYEEKLALLRYLVFSAYDMPSFRDFMKERLNEKNGLSRQKQETYVLIKNLQK